MIEAVLKEAQDGKPLLFELFKETGGGNERCRAENKIMIKSKTAARGLIKAKKRKKIMLKKKNKQTREGRRGKERKNPQKSQ